MGKIRAGLETRLEEVRANLKRLNESSVRSLDEGLEETLTPHRLGVGPALRRSLATTNGLESIFSLVEQRTGKVDRVAHQQPETALARGGAAGH